MPRENLYNDITIRYTIFLKTQIYTQIYFHHISCNVIVYGWDSERTTASYEKD
jgi:hypothetical protein